MRFQRPPATPLLGCAAILVDFIGLGMIAPILPGIVSSDAVGASRSSDSSTKTSDSSNVAGNTPCI